jgi:hypothetical protein
MNIPPGVSGRVVAMSISPGSCALRARGAARDSVNVIADAPVGQADEKSVAPL